MTLLRWKYFYGILRMAVIFSIIFFFPRNGASSPLSVSLGPLFEYNFYGQLGIRAALSHDKVLGGRPQIMLSYTTSRLSFWNGKNALIIDDILFNAAWRFRPKKLIDPYVGIDIGFIRFDRENHELFASLDNKAVRLNIRTGVQASFFNGRLQPSLDVGYAVIYSSTVFPLFISCSVRYDSMKGIRR
jgi:hypothetical protein